MEMSEKDIVQSYMMAKQRGNQIKILADLNCCTKEKIMEILKNNGIEVNGRVFNGGNHKKDQPETQPEVKSSFSSVKPEAPEVDSAYKVTVCPKENGFLQDKPKETKPDVVIPDIVFELADREIRSLIDLNEGLIEEIEANKARIEELRTFVNKAREE